jgi:hypothetical protein
MSLRVFVDRKDSAGDSVFGIVTVVEPNGDAFSLRCRVVDPGTPLQQTELSGEHDQVSYLSDRYGGEFPLMVAQALVG